MRLLIQVGLIQLAVAALTGWILVAWREKPGWLKRVGVKVPRRILQLHIDYVMMGLILIAVGLVVPELSLWLAIPLVFGTTINPLLFLPLAFEPEFDRRLIYRGLATLSFIAVGVGLVGAAISYA